MIDLETVRAIADAGGQVTRRGREWLAGDRVLARSDVGRLYRTGMLSGRRGSGTYGLTDAARKGLRLASARILAAGSRVAFRDTGYSGDRMRRYREGRVITNTCGRLIVDCGGELYELERRGTDGRWKGSRTSPGRFRSSPVWPLLQGYLPASWFQPLSSASHTLARLREVRTRLESIGAYYGVTAEEQVAMNYSDLGLPYLRRGPVWTRGPAGEYLLAVIASDAAEIEAAERAQVLEETKRCLWPRTWGIYDAGLVTVPSLQQACSELSSWSPDLVKEAYVQALPAAQERADHLNEVRHRRRARTGAL